MHFHCEIVIPPTDDIEGTIKSVLSKFDENAEESEDHSRAYAFWDFYTIGGRWAGNKLMARYDEAKIEEFEEWMKSEKITISGLQFGKQELSPASQIPKVDAKWNEMFGTGTPCPMFEHSNGRHETLPDDVMRLADVPERLKASHVIFAGPDYDSDTKDFTGPIEAKFMLTDSAYNGCNYMDVDWDGTFASAHAKYLKTLENSRSEYAAKFRPQPDWLVVTVDYHT